MIIKMPLPEILMLLTWANKSYLQWYWPFWTTQMPPLRQGKVPHTSACSEHSGSTHMHVEFCIKETEHPKEGWLHVNWRDMLKSKSQPKVSLNIIFASTNTFSPRAAGAWPELGLGPGDLHIHIFIHLKAKQCNWLYNPVTNNVTCYATQPQTSIVHCSLY